MRVSRPKSHPDLWVFRDVSPTDVPGIRSLPGRNWNTRVKGHWTVPRCREVYTAMLSAKFVTDPMPKDLKSAYTVKRAESGLFLLTTLGTPSDVLKCKGIPAPRQFSAHQSGWLFKPTQQHIAYVKKNFADAWWDGTTEHIADSITAREIAPRPDEITAANALRAAMMAAVNDPINDYKFKTAGYSHQLTAFKISRNMVNFGLLMEMGTGKGWVIVNTVGYQFLKSEITGFLVVCPNGMKEPWAEELDKHLPPEIPCDTFIWEARTRHKAEAWIRAVSPGVRKLRVFIMNVEALSGSTGSKMAQLFLSKHTCLMTIDESTRIKSPSASRTKMAVKLGKLAKFRRIMSGAPVTQGPLDLYAQFKFLGDSILGFSTFYAMRNRYAIMGGFEGRQIISYQYLDELTAKVDTVSFRALKRDCLDLPDKIYEKRIIELSPQQRGAYDQMAEELRAEIAGMDGRKLAASVMHVITRVMRCQQIVGGFLPVEDPDNPGPAKTLAIPGGNPKIEALLDIIDDQPDDAKIIIWARFRAELAAIEVALQGKYGEGTVASFHGGVDNVTRGENRRDFQDTNSCVRFFVGQPVAGGIGLTLTAASLMVYFSNDHSLETRLQSEDRFHRIGQTAAKCTIIDLVAKKTGDGKILSALRSKKSLADLVQGDPSLSWL